MNTARILQKYYKLFKYFPKTNSKSKLSSLYKNAIHSSVFWGSFFLIDPETELKRNLQIENNINKVRCSCVDSKKAINKLILNLEDALINTCKKYRQCLEKQITVLEKGIGNNSTDEYWKNLADLRVEANVLKRNCESFRCMLAYVGQLSFNAGFCTATISNLKKTDYVSNEYFKLERTAKDEIAKNMKLEEILSRKNMKSLIVNHTKTEDSRHIIRDSIDFLVQKVGLAIS